MSVECPECGYNFSNKKDFRLFEAGEIIQCPVCQTELKVNRDRQLEALDLEQDEHEP